MIKNNKIKYLIFTFVILSCFMISRSFIVKADSGFDSSWDSGGGSFSDGGSFDFSSDSDGGDPIVYLKIMGVVALMVGTFFAYAKTADWVFPKSDKIPWWFFCLWVVIYLISVWLILGIGYFIGVLVMAAIVVLMIALENVKIGEKPKIKILSEDKIKAKLGNDFDINKFYTDVFTSYKDIQTAWMNKDIDSVRHLLADEILNTYRMQLLTLEKKNQTNIMKDIEFVDAGIISINKQNDKEVIKVKLEVTCRDYLIDKEKNVIRGKNNAINHYIYQLTFSRVKGDKINYCLNCGAKLGDGSSNVCEYCRSVIISDSTRFIMIDKKMLSQKLKGYK